MNVYFKKNRKIVMMLMMVMLVIVTVMVVMEVLLAVAVAMFVWFCGRFSAVIFS